MIFEQVLKVSVLAEAVLEPLQDEGALKLQRAILDLCNQTLCLAQAVDQLHSRMRPFEKTFTNDMGPDTELAMGWIACRSIDTN